MELKIVNKHKICIASAIFLVILLSQYKSFNLLIHTILGRFILVLLILGIASSSVFCGIIAVLYVIIMIHQSDKIYLEGFGDKNGDMLEKFKEKIEESKNQRNTTLASSSAAMASTETFIGREGFNITEREDNMLKGKNSKQISVQNNGSTTDVSPTSKEDFSTHYSSF